MKSFRTICIPLYYIAHLPQQCHNSKSVIFQKKFLKVLKCYNFLWAQRRHNCPQAASFCKLRYDTIPVKRASTNVSFYTNNSKMSNFELWHSCRKWNIYIYIYIYICVTTQNLWFFRRNVWRFWSAIIFYECNGRHNRSPTASFANYVMTLHLLKVHLQMFLSIPITSKCQILSCNTLVANEQYTSWDLKITGI